MSENYNLDKYSKADYVSLAVKSILGAAAIAGPLLTELVGNVIPHQRIDRIVKFSKNLENRMNKIEQSNIKSAITNDNFADLVEEGLHQAARSLSDERRVYITNIIANSITSDEISISGVKAFIKITRSNE